MSTDGSPSTKLPAWTHLLIAFVLALDVAVVWQWADGAFKSEFGGHEDEAVHYLMAVGRGDAAKTQSSFTAFAGGVAPAFDIVLRGWILAFGGSRVSVLLFNAMLAAANATVIFAVTRANCGLWAGAVAGIIWLCAPLVRASSQMVLPDQMRLLTLTLTVVGWASTLNSHRRVFAVLTSVAGIAAIFAGVNVLTVALAIVLVPLLLKEASAIRQPRAWITAAVIFAAGAFRTTVAPWPALSLNLVTTVRELPLQLGIAIAAFALAGILLGARRSERGQPLWAACVAIVAAVGITVSLFGQGMMDREYLTASRALAILAAAGAVATARATFSRSAAEHEYRKRSALFVLLLLLLALAPAFTSDWRKDWSGYGATVTEILEHSQPGTTVLVISDRRGEGAMLVEAAMLDREGLLKIERGSEVLADAQSTDSGDFKRQRFDDDALFKHLLKSKFDYIILDSSVLYDGKTAFQDQMQRVIEDHASEFWPVFATPLTRDGETRAHGLRVFRVVRRDAPTAPPRLSD